MLRSLFSPTNSLRGAKKIKDGKWKVDPEVQADEEEGVLGAEVLTLLEEEYWAKYDDIRWAFFKESQ